MWNLRLFKHNHARLHQFALAYNLGNFLRFLALPRSVKNWSSTTQREKLIKIGARVVRHAKYVTFQMAEVALPHELFAATLERTQRFGMPAAVGAPWLTRTAGTGLQVGGFFGGLASQPPGASRWALILDGSGRSVKPWHRMVVGRLDCG